MRINQERKYIVDAQKYVWTRGSIKYAKQILWQLAVVQTAGYNFAIPVRTYTTSCTIQSSHSQFNSAAAKPNIKQNQNLLFIISSVQLNRGHHELMEVRAALFHESYKIEFNSI